MIREYDCECYDCPMAYPPILDECIEDIWCDKVGGKLYGEKSYPVRQNQSVKEAESFEELWNKRRSSVG